MQQQKLGHTPSRSGSRLRLASSTVIRIRTLACLAVGTMLLSANVCPGLDTVATKSGDVVVRVSPQDQSIKGWKGDNKTTTVLIFKTREGQTYTPDLLNLQLLALDSVRMSWQSSNVGVATIANDGMAITSTPTINFVAPGTATITGTVNDPRLTLADGVNGTNTIDVTVSEAPAKLQITPHGSTLTVGQSQTFNVGVTSASGGAVISTGRENVKFECVGPGHCVINTSADSAGASFRLNEPSVTPIGGTVDAKALTPGTGRVIASLVVTKNGDPVTLATDTITINVVAPVVPARVAIDPGAASVFVGGTKQLSASVFDASNNLISVPVTWQTKDASIATVSSLGLVSAVSTGSASLTSNTVQIVAKAAEGVQATATITIYKPVASVLVQPNPSSMDIGAVRPFTATLRDNSNATIPAAATTITWSTGSSAIATVDINGAVTAKAAGTTTVTARTTEGVSGSADLTVNAPPPAGAVVRVVVLPDSVDVPISVGSIQFRAKAYDANGVEVPVPGGFSWVVDNSNVGDVDNTGKVTFGIPGKTFVRAFMSTAADAIGGAAVLRVTQ